MARLQHAAAYWYETEESRLCAECRETRKVVETGAVLNDRSDRFVRSYLIARSGVVASEFAPYTTIIAAVSGIAEDSVAGLIKELPYHLFLQTPYWKAIAQEVKGRSNFHCCVCPNASSLHIHHRTYENHGYEHRFLDDLTCLCQACHAKFHNRPSSFRKNSRSGHTVRSSSLG